MTTKAWPHTMTGPQAKKCKYPPEFRKGRETDPALETSEVLRLCWHHGFKSCSFWTSALLKWRWQNHVIMFSSYLCYVLTVAAENSKQILSELGLYGENFPQKNKKFEVSFLISPLTWIIIKPLKNRNSLLFLLLFPFIAKECETWWP